MIPSLSKPMHHKIFNTVSKRAHAAAMKAASQNLEKARRLTEEVSGADVAALFNGTWQKRGHKSHNGVVTSVFSDTGLQ